MRDFFTSNKDNNFLSQFIHLQPTTQKAKHFYESYLHLHNIATRIPPKYSALLHERAMESDKNWRTLIRVSYEIIHQSLCLIGFYRKIIVSVFNPLQYYKLSAIFMFFNENECNYLSRSLPWNNNQRVHTNNHDHVRQELVFYEKRLGVIKQMNNEYSMSQQQYSSDNIFGITNEMTNDLFQQKLYNFNQYSLIMKSLVIIYQVYNVNQRFLFFDTTSRADLTASVIDVQ